MVLETTMAKPGVTILEAVLVNGITPALLGTPEVKVGMATEEFSRTPGRLTVTGGGLKVGKILARLPVRLDAGSLPAFYAVAVVMFVTSTVETAMVGAAGVPTGGLVGLEPEEEPLPLYIPPEPPETVKLAQVMRVLFANCTTMLRLPIKAGVSSCSER